VQQAIARTHHELCKDRKSSKIRREVFSISYSCEETPPPTNYCPKKLENQFQENNIIWGQCETSGIGSREFVIWGNRQQLAWPPELWGQIDTATRQT